MTAIPPQPTERIKVKASEEDLRLLVAGEQVPLEAAIRVFQEHCGLLTAAVEYGESLMEDAGRYLSGWALRRFIRADITDDVAREEILSNRILLDRMRHLFPAVLAQLKIDAPERARVVFNIVYDACKDYPAVLASGREEANRKKLIRRMANLQQRVADLSVLLENSELTHEGGFEPAQRRYMKRVHGEDGEVRSFWKLQRDIRFLSWYLELEVYRARTRPNSLWVPGNQAKTHIVDTAYGLILYAGHPAFVTTPGSDFAYLCSLLLEIATAKRDESLAGAINRYARSSERAEADQNELEYSEESNRARDEDNFYDIKNATFGSDEQVAELLSEARDRALSSEARLLVLCEMDEMVEAVENRDKIHGPFIVWAHQMKRDWAQELHEIDTRAIEELRHDIEIGEQRRAKRKST